MYKAIEYFTDLQDNGYAYKVGDEYPRKGYNPSEDRINELAGKENVRGRAVIAEEIPVETVAEEEEKPKKRSRKKADE